VQISLHLSTNPNKKPGTINNLHNTQKKGAESHNFIANFHRTKTCSQINLQETTRKGIGPWAHTKGTENKKKKPATI